MTGMLGAARVRGTLLPCDQEEHWIEVFESLSFGDLPEGKGIGIFPYYPQNLGPTGYDLSVGAWAYSLRDADFIDLSEQEQLTFEPGETILVLTHEFVALSPRFAGLTISKARIMNEGLALSSAKLDPTWYGCLPIPITNNSRKKFRLRVQQPFCTVLFFELDCPASEEDFLTKAKVPHLGQRKLTYEPHHAVPWEPLRPDQVAAQDMDKAVAFGPPFDIVRGMFEYSKADIIEYMENQWSPETLKDLRRKLRDEEFARLDERHQKDLDFLQRQLDIFEKQQREAKTDRRVLMLAVIGWLVIAIIQLAKT